MLQRMRAGWVVIAGLVACVSAVGRSQDSVVRSVAVPAHSGVAVAPLDRTIALSLRQVSLKEALTILATRARIQLAYSVTRVPVDQLVSIEAGAITVRDALAVLLDGTGLTASVSRAGRVVIEPGRVRASQGVATITGRVTDATLKTPLAQVTVRVEGTPFTAAANGEGTYTIAGLTPTTYRVTARRVGYQPLTKEIRVVPDQLATLDFALTAAPTRLDEVVTTAVGEQHRYQVGNVISTINVDSIAPTAPVVSLTDLMSGRAPGVEVIETNGLTGSGPAIRIRGQSSLVLQSNPIVIVDGMRQDNTPGGALGLFGSINSPARLNDLNLADIATIDVLKGPAATTEYGTDAANGVIVVTTKHGTAGPPQWAASIDQMASSIPGTFPAGYYSWGHTTDGTNTAVNCPLVPLPYGGGSTTGNCALDSVSAWNPLNHPSYSIFGSGARTAYDLSVSGGSEALRYFIAGGLSDERGIADLPDVFRGPAIALGFPNSVFQPNGENQRSVRTTTTARLGPTADLTVTGAYLSTFQKTIDVNELFVGMFYSPALPDSAHGYGYAGAGPTSSPLYQLGQLANQQNNRLTAGISGNWRPVPGVAAHATIGIDHGSQQATDLFLPQASAYSSGQPNGGQSQITSAGVDIYSVDLRASATAALARDVRSVTSLGLQLADTRSNGISAAVYGGLSATNVTLNGAVNPFVTQELDRAATLGGYGEEQLSFADRLFLTGALRVDAGSGFGRSYSTAIYPKGSISWLAVATGPTSIRLRAAFGESGVQPHNGAALQLYTPAIGWANGGAISGLALQTPGNPALEPERSVEYEGGGDLSLWSGRLSLDMTAYSKTTDDALMDLPLGWTLGGYSAEENIGQVRNTGWEGTITVGLVNERALSWTLSLNASMNHNQLIHLAPGVAPGLIYGAFATSRQEPGYPLYGYWAQHYSYADANHDGIIESDEITLSDSSSYVGSSLPTQEASLATHISVWNGALALGMLFDGRSGLRVANSAAFDQAIHAQSEAAANLSNQPLWLQARSAAAIAAITAGNYALPAGFYEDGSYVRLREVSVTYVAPHRIIRVLRLTSASVTGAVRNLALWTRYTGPDPEVSNTGGNSSQYTVTGNRNVNDDVREDYGAIPLARYLVLRVNLGL
jgi:TonB-linked SusC/RagA family outer membrane protein